MLHLKNALCLRNVLRPVHQIRFWSTQAVHLDDQINKDLESEVYKPKSHPGRVRLQPVKLPEAIHSAIKTGVNDTQIPQFVEDGNKLDRYLFARHIPIEKREELIAKREIQKNILRKAGVRHVSELDVGSDARSAQALREEVTRVYKQQNYCWAPIVYNQHKAWSYLFGRSAKEYAILMQIFNEIARRDPEFRPRSFFDFGAGVGSGTWAASTLWKKSLYEYYCVDESSDMNDLAELILRGGNADKNISLTNVYYRQFLPASYEFKSHLVLSAFTLNELPNESARLETLLTLWKKCDGYLVLVENGSNAGFKLIEEARDYLLAQAKKDDSAYLFAPCPHELPCPRAVKDDGTPCNFAAKFRSLDLGQNASDQVVLYSHVVFKKGSRTDDKTIDWPRMVRPTQVRSRHTRCQFCTHRGKLEEVVITKRKHSKYTYRCARKSDWGDRMPIEFEEKECDSADGSDFSDDDKP